MDDNMFKLTLYTLLPGALAIGVYGIWQGRVKLQQMRELPAVIQAAGLQLFENPQMQASFRFLPEFKPQPDGIERTRYAAKGRIRETDILTFVYDERRGRSIHPILVLIATLPRPVVPLSIYTRRTVFGPITPLGQQVFKTNNDLLDKTFRISAVSQTDFNRMVTPELQKYLLENQDITQVEIAENAVALFNTDSRFFQWVNNNGIPSKAQFEKRLQQVRELQKMIAMAAE